MTPRKAWETIAGVIRIGDNAEAQIQAMQSVLDFIRLACTQCHTDWPDHCLISEAPTSPHPSVPTLERAIEARLKTDLPGIRGDTGPQTSMTSAINHLTSEMLRVNQDRVHQEQGAKAKTPVGYYRQGVSTLYRITYVSSVQQLPEVYQDIAQSPKRMERQAIEERLRTVADTLGLLDFIPIATATLTKKMTSCDFSHVDTADLEAGIHPFVTCYRSIQDRTKLKQNLSIYDDLREGTSANVVDFRVLKEAEKAGIPYFMTEVTHAFKSFRVLLHTLLGSLHPLVQAWDKFVSMWIGRETKLNELLEMRQFPLVMRWLQMRFSMWFTDQHREPIQVHVPEFEVLIKHIIFGEAWEPILPPQYQAILPMLGGYPTPTVPQVPTPPVRPPVAPAPGPPRPPVPAVPPLGGQRGETLNNNEYDEVFLPFRALQLPLVSVRDKAKAANKPVPSGHH
jgi:hypothetical protein